MRWARWSELVTAGWLAASPWVIRPHAAWVTAFDVGMAAAIAICSLLSFRRATERAHLVGLALAGVLAGVGWLGRTRGEGMLSHENHVITGLVLMMLTILPTHALSPPRSWRRPSELS